MYHRSDNVAGRRIVPVLAILMIFAGLLCFVHVWELKNNAAPEQTVSQPVTASTEGRYIWMNDQWYSPRKDLRTLLLIGVDKFAKEPAEGYLNNEQCDFLVLLIIDNHNNTVSALHINRDTMTNVPVLGVTGQYIGSSYSQIALAHTYGSGGKDSCRNTIDSVSSLLYDLNIDQYAAITMDAVSVLNDDIGGVTVKIEDDFSQTSLGWNVGEEVTLKGDEALSFVRARGELEDSSNLRRMERQRTYSTAFQQTLKSALEEDSDLPLKLINDIGEYLVTDCTTSQLQRYCEMVSESTFTGFETIPGVAILKDSHIQFYVDEEAFKELLVGIFYEPAEE